MTIRLVLAVAAVLAPVMAHAQTFTHVETRIQNGLFSEIVAIADFNVDGRDDVVLVGYREWNRRHEAEDRLIDKAPMRLFLGTRNGRFRPAPSRFRLARVRNPIAVVADFNGDDRPDLAVFDAGIYDWKIRSGIGNPPQLYLSRGQRLVRSSALANAVRRENRRRGPDEEPRPSGPADLHIKAAAAGDIDGDGDVDLWIESSGGENFTSHFMLNQGRGQRFEVDRNRVPYELLHNPPPEYWRHTTSYFFDLENDGDLDLALGQIRDDDPTHVNQSSIILINDGTGHFRSRIELPAAAILPGLHVGRILRRLGRQRRRLSGPHRHAHEERRRRLGTQPGGGCLDRALRPGAHQPRRQLVQRRDAYAHAAGPYARHAIPER